MLFQLSYAIEIADVANRDERWSLRVDYNSVRKDFGYQYFESATNLQNRIDSKRKRSRDSQRVTFWTNCLATTPRHSEGPKIEIPQRCHFQEAFPSYQMTAPGVFSKLLLGNL